METKQIKQILDYEIDPSKYLDVDLSKQIVRFFFGIINVDWVENIYQKHIKTEHNKSDVCGQIALFYHAIIRCIITNRLAPLNCQSIKNYQMFLRKITTHNISPFAQIEGEITLLGSNITIYGDYKICDQTTLNSGTLIGDKNFDANILYNIDNDNNILDGVKNIYVVDKKCVIGCYTKICFCNIAKGVKICDFAIVRENVSANARVEILNQLQVVLREKSYIPSQELCIYGLVPKYKNTLTIFGEGIYNPKVIIRCDGKKVGADIEYWDKNKIILKIKGFISKTSSSSNQSDTTENSSLSSSVDVSMMCLDGDCLLDDKLKSDKKCVSCCCDSFDKKFNNSKPSVVVVMSRGIKVSVNDMGVIKRLLKNI